MSYDTGEIGAAIAAPAKATKSEPSSGANLVIAAASDAMIDNPFYKQWLCQGRILELIQSAAMFEGVSRLGLVKISDMSSPARKFEDRR
jgi:hypothetical protein